jgi:hypothetical protein
MCSCDVTFLSPQKQLLPEEEDSNRGTSLLFSNTPLSVFCGLHEEEDPLNKNKNKNKNIRATTTTTTREEKRKRDNHHHENSSDDGKAQKTLFFVFFFFFFLLPSPLVVDGIMRSALLFFVWRRGSGENAETIRGHGTSDGGTTRRSSFRATEEEQRVG